MNELINISIAINVFKYFIFSAIFYVWVVKYQNIVKEFKEFQLPDWLRDIVGVFKLTFALMIISTNNKIALIGSLGISILMVAALLTHLKVKNPFYKMIPSMSLMVISSLIFLSGLEF